MTTYTVTFPEASSIPDLLAQLAAESGVTPETLIIRAVAENLGNYGVSKSVEEMDTSITTLNEFLTKAGVYKTGLV